MENGTIIYERTVRKMMVRPAKENLTKRNYFDLEKINNLRIVDSGFIKKLRKKYQMTQKKLSYIVDVPLRTLIGWESYKKSIPFGKLVKLAKALNLEKDDMLELIDGSEFTFGRHHGKNRMRIPIDPKKFKLAQYIVPLSYEKNYLIKDTPEGIKRHVLNNFSIDSYSYKKLGLVTIYSYLLNRFLKTFYHYDWFQSIEFPLSAYIQEWKGRGADLVISVILPLLLSDGGEKPNNRLYCSGESDTVHDIWSDAWYYCYNILPSSYKVPVKNKTIFITTHNIIDDIMNNLKEICPSFKTSPYRQKEDEYLNDNQPTIGFLLKAEPLEQQIAIRIWASVEGNTGIHLDRKTKLITPVFKISCAHPYLVKQIRKLLEYNKIHTSITFGKTWSGINAISSSSIKSAINFLKIGGFIRGVKISRHSRYYCGFEKEDILLSIFELMKRQRENPRFRSDNTNKINKYIKNIALDKEFGSEEYYVKYFGD